MTQAVDIKDATNPTALADLQVARATSQVSNNPIELIVQGTPGNDSLRGGLANELLMGGDGNDYIVSGGGNDVMVPGAGADSLSGGAGNDVFRFERISDSYISGAGESTDSISYFDPAHDILDVSALGYSHLGNGYGDTLHIRSEPLRGIYFLESYERDQNGHRFAVQFLANSGVITDANLQPLINGTSQSNLLVGTDGSETLKAGAGRDTVEAGADNDRLFGGAGGDTLSGGAGADTFVYTRLSDSYRNDASGSYSSRDLITDFSGNDHDMIDVSALGFTGLGNGYNGTLKVVLNLAGDATALKSLEADANGNRFEILLSGNHVNELNTSTVLFAPPSDATVVTSPQPITPVNLAGGDKSETLYGYWGNDTLAGGAGNDILEGNAGDDVLTGGLGADKLTGGTGNDRFVFTSSADSHAGSSDLITDFIWGEDKLDVAALGVTGFGNGRDGTLSMTYDENTDRTYLRSREPGADGHAFQVTLVGFDYTRELTNADLVVADTADVALVGQTAVDLAS
ncbi:M10 family metallopeptidase C-terminal domain-containing protein [Pseudomonas syringae]|uniref:M10 family metallopeptidase C-terminal domain-containing protein n=1 Tax=Pseudomonas syringae TaxID=317 RepID=UPI001F0E8617|nr:M10 family metallopeptidase C-terminal domain-containing protein [Pseudomonas syringae]MCH5510526.1 M10 family metallopeptidase C-terminal domain-containing protein [Pseudomonas syringae pv. syringae]MCH5639227.1 M10 family metallopeptidase C-terminal domain-containing protein [Pseudomonas syringae pv. syringae]MCH7428416.1 M10 family metallopeptidase C-terminal domain-containing protein [Pseudomonas syringae pv. syringae]